MAISKEMEAEIIRLSQAEGWRNETIARQLGIHHSTVERALAENHLLPASSQKRPSKIDPFLPFIRQTLEKYPKLTATRLFNMVKQRGYSGRISHFRFLISRLRPIRSTEAFLRLTTLPGEQAQVDWACFGKIQIGKAERRLLAFVMVLSWSRQIFLRFYLGDGTANFLRGHVDGFHFFGHVPREILYDNLKSAVIERVDNAIRFNRELLDLSAHYRFAPKPVAVRRANEKGRVERAISYVRTNFYAARQYKNLTDLNEQATAWCMSEAKERPCPEDKSMTVSEAFQKEKDSLLPLPDSPYPVYDRKVVEVGKTPYVRFESNDYSVPHTLVRRTLLVETTIETVRVVDGLDVVAEHQRSFDKGKLIEDPAHTEGLVREKRRASRQRGMTRILNVAPSSRQFFKLAAERGHNMGRLTQSLAYFLDLYGGAELEAALTQVLAAGTVHSAAVQNALEMRRVARGLPPPVALRFLKDSRIDALIVQPKTLDDYDELINWEDGE
jgi:transposase